MPNQDAIEPPEEWLARIAPESGVASPAPTVDDVQRLAQQLDYDERLRLIARLWKSLPTTHQAAFLTLQQAQRRDGATPIVSDGPGAPIEPMWPAAHALLFDTSHTSDLYSAPRRFDLATIFVVTAAYSLLLGALSGMSAPPLVKVVITALITIIAVAQAFFLKVANPRGVSIITGAIAYTAISILIWVNYHNIFINSFFFVVIVNGVLGGGIIGYLFGTLVGGVFLVADKLRAKMERGHADEASDELAADELEANGTTHE
ncbi:MAG TPA: hypothetical protein VHU84_15770 [Lacipirellulaceae bacterium]|jgi:hypothetical protein|nr:hypothetical protein [Lacipirellulaceae bacterium]